MIASLTASILIEVSSLDDVCWLINVIALLSIALRR